MHDDGDDNDFDDNDDGDDDGHDVVHDDDDVDDEVDDDNKGGSVGVAGRRCQLPKGKIGATPASDTPWEMN